MSEQTVLKAKEGEIFRITVNRPDQLNALNRQVLTELKAACEEGSADGSVRLITVQGAGGKAFVAGADIAEMDSAGADELRSFVELGQATMRSFEASPKPVVALVNGFALGGGMELALSCDMILASSKAKFGQPEVKLGIIPGFGGTQRLLYKVGLAMTKRLVFAGEIIRADEALRAGMIEYCFEADAFEARCREWETELLKKAPLAITEAKKLLHSVVDSALEKGLASEVESFLGLFATEDRAEGMKAFLEKRDPNFSGK